VHSRAYILCLLVILCGFNQLDRYLTAILLPLIGAEFALSDVQLGVLSGIAFAILFGIFTIPASIWAVRYNRRNLVAASAGFWGTMTLLTGFAQSFWHLLLTRIGLGIGEAGSVPASHAIITDLYHPHERATALAIWSSGYNFGLFVAFLIGGYVGQVYGWRIAFVIAGIGTMLTALVLLLTTHDAVPKGGADARRNAAAVAIFRNALFQLGADSASRHVIVAATLIAIVGNGALACDSSARHTSRER
jgi:MFS family permease